jgi:hypothetical protein
VTFTPSASPNVHINGYYKLSETPFGSGVFTPSAPNQLELLPSGPVQGTLIASRNEFQSFEGTFIVASKKTTQYTMVTFTPQPPVNVKGKIDNSKCL